MNTSLSFTLPEDEEALRQCLDARYAFQALRDLDGELRRRLKYVYPNKDTWPDAVREAVTSEVEDIRKKFLEEVSVILSYDGC